MGNIKNRRAVSPVIATVILVAVAITIAVAVAYWMGGISSQYTRFEKVEITSAYCEYIDDLSPYAAFNATPGWVITMDFRNTGTTEASVDEAFVNSKKWTAYGNHTTGLDPISAWEVWDTAGSTKLFTTSNEKLVCLPGIEDSLYIVIQDCAAISFTSGVTVEVSIHTGAGNNYMKMVTLS